MERAARHEEAGIDDVLDRRYTLLREIARGGQGAVFEAEHLVTRARVAIKTLTRPALDMLEAHTRLIREARVLAALRHPNLVAIHDAGTCAQYGPYLVLEMLEGRSLAGILLTRQRLPVGQAMAVTVQLCDALSEVHRHGIVHRDIKPSNVLIARARGGDRVALIDFGVATVGQSLGPAEERASKLTKAGELLGTVEYMSPEQLMGTGPVEARADVYGTGVLLYECLTGEMPYSGPPTVVMTNMLAGTRPASIRSRRDDVPRTLEAVVGKALELEPAKRYASSEEFARACVIAFGAAVPSIDLLDVRDDRSGAPISIAKPADPSAPPPATEAAVRRRQYVRAPYVTPVRVLLDKAHPADGRTEDISEGGILMVMDSPCADGQRVRVRLPLPVSGRVVELEGITKWIKTRKNQRAVGVEFTDAGEDVRAAIRAYVALMTGAASKVPRV